MKLSGVQTARLLLQPVSDQTLSVSVFNCLKRTNVCANAGQSVILRLTDAVSEPVRLDKIGMIKTGENYIHYHLCDNSGAFNASLQIKPVSERLSFRLKVNGPQPLWLAEWKIANMPHKEILVPALGGQAITDKMPEGIQVSYKYPFWLNAQFVIARNRDGGIMISSEEKRARMKMVRVERTDNAFSITYGFENNAPLRNESFEAEWFLDAFAGSWQAAVDQHRTWMESALDLKFWYQHAHKPSWVNKISFILEIWGARRDAAIPHHSFDEMGERLRTWAKLYDPGRTLLYLPGFAENGIDSHAPDYHPSRQCGGVQPFKRLMQLAHRLGYRVMLHTNVLAMTFTHPLFPDFKKYQVVDVFGRPQGWGLDMDGDWLAEPYFAYINPGYRAWGRLMTGVLGELIHNFKVDAVFLDQTLLAFNVKKGPNFIKGMADHIRRLQKAFPEILFAGEGLHEQNVSCLPFVQIHGLDSLKDIHGQDETTSWRRVHPISVYLFGKYTRFCGHLLTRHPEHPDFAFQESAYAQLNIIPVLALYNRRQAVVLPEVKKMINRASSIQHPESMFISRKGKT